MKAHKLVHIGVLFDLNWRETASIFSEKHIHLYLFQNIPKNVHLISSRSRATNIDINKQTHINMESILLKGILEALF